MTREEFAKTRFHMSYEEYSACDCTKCDKEGCVHRCAYRRVPRIDGGLGICPNLQALKKAHEDASRAGAQEK